MRHKTKTNTNHTMTYRCYKCGKVIDLYDIKPPADFHCPCGQVTQIKERYEDAFTSSDMEDIKQTLAEIKATISKLTGKNIIWEITDDNADIT